jgi:NO-binding membrane sensor protein with MHYT domain
MPDHMDSSYSLPLVVLSYVVAVLASHVTLSLAQRLRPHGGDAGPAHTPHWPWIIGGAFSMGTGIWSMHFIGMLAFDMGMPVAYDVPVTALSLVLAWLVSAIGFWIASRGEPSLLKIIVAGTVMGCGVAIMHYTGMAAMRMAAVMTFDPTLVAVSVVIAVVASCAALWLALHLTVAWQMAAAAVVMGVAVTGMHYTGMVAARFNHDPALVAPQVSSVSTDFLAYTVFLLSLIIMVLGAAFGRVEMDEDLVLE